MRKILDFIYELIKKIIITIILIPLACLLGILMYSEALFVVIFYLWVKPEKAKRLWVEFKNGLKEVKEGKRKLVTDKKFYLLAIIGLLLTIIGYFCGK